jgi:hypothetical protein
VKGVGHRFSSLPCVFGPGTDALFDLAEFRS